MAFPEKKLTYYFLIKVLGHFIAQKCTNFDANAAELPQTEISVSFSAIFKFFSFLKVQIKKMFFSFNKPQILSALKTHAIAVANFQ